MRRWVLLLAMLAPTAFAAAPPSSPDRRTDLERLQGEWDMVPDIVFLKKTGVADEVWEDPVQSDNAVKGHRFRWLGTDVAFSLDDTKNPKEITFTDDMRGEKVLGIYRLEGDTLTICLRMLPPTAVRPASFDAPSKVDVLYHFRRKKP